MIKFKELKEVIDVLGFGEDVNVEHYNNKIVLSDGDGKGGVDIFTDMCDYNLFVDTLGLDNSNKCSVFILDDEDNIDTYIGMYDYRV